MRSLCREMAAPWPGLQFANGTYPDNLHHDEAPASTRYGEAMLGYGLLMTGVRENDDALIVGGDGTVTVTGGFLGGDGNWRRRGVSFAFAPVADGGVRLRFNATAGDRFEHRVFFVDVGAAPQSDATSVFDGTLRATHAALHDVAFEDGYASDAEPKLVRARLALRAVADGPLDVTVGPA